MKLMKNRLMAIALAMCACLGLGATDYTSMVNPLVGTLSSFELSTGNTYPAIALPWGMNFWTPQTGKMGDGWQYVTYGGATYGYVSTKYLDEAYIRARK